MDCGLIVISRLFGQRKKGRNDKTWAILTPTNAHLAMKNAGVSIRIGGLGKCDAR